MVDRSMSTRSEDGTTLAELLVVMTIFLTIGLITTTGIVQAFGAQRTASSVSETLDGTRIATQRVRDVLRGADEVCASSTATSLVLWTDDDGDGSVVSPELDIFEMTTSGGKDVFQRRTPTVGGDVVQLIRDDIINSSVFTYDVSPTSQPSSDVTCTDGATLVTPSAPSPIRLVEVTFLVENPDPDPLAADLETSTSVRLRNADLEDGVTNASPTASFTIDCPNPDRACSFDASGSSDSDGSIVSYAWTFAQQDGTVLSTDTGSTASYTFPLGAVDYDVTLVVTDDLGATGQTTQVVTPLEPGVNAPPSADFSVSCLGRICSFDATTSTDDSAIAGYSWDFAGLASGTGSTATYTFPSDGDRTVVLTVTDDDGATDSESKTFFAGGEAIYVQSLTGSKGGSGSNRTITLNVQLAKSTAGTPGAGLTVSFLIDMKRRARTSTRAARRPPPAGAASR